VGTGAELFLIWVFCALFSCFAAGAVLGVFVIFLKPFDGKISGEIWLSLGVCIALAAVFDEYFVQVQIKMDREACRA